MPHVFDPDQLKDSLNKQGSIREKSIAEKARQTQAKREETESLTGSTLLDSVQEDTNKVIRVLLGLLNFPLLIFVTLVGGFHKREYKRQMQSDQNWHLLLLPGLIFYLIGGFVIFLTIGNPPPTRIHRDANTPVYILWFSVVCLTLWNWLKVNKLGALLFPIVFGLLPTVLYYMKLKGMF